MRAFGPKTADHPGVGETCPICGHVFQEGDYTTLVARAPASEEEAEKRRAGRAYTARADEVCWEHAAAIGFMTGEEVVEPLTSGL